MVGLKDITDLLDKIPIWKRVKEAPDRLDELEKRMDALEKKWERAPGEACPSCGAYAMRLTRPGRRLGSPPNEFRHDHWECKECGFKDVRLNMMGRQ